MEKELVQLCKLMKQCAGEGDWEGTKWGTEKGIRGAGHV